MRAFKQLRALGAGLVIGGIALTAMPAATAAPAGNFTVACKTSTYPVFDWNVSVDATAAVEGGATRLTLQLSELPGVAPVPMRDLGMTATLDVLVDGAPVTLTGQGMVSFEADTPFAIPAASGTIVGTPTTLDVVIRRMAYNIPSFEMNTVCPGNGEAAELRLAAVPVAGAPQPESVSRSTERSDATDNGDAGTAPSPAPVTPQPVTSEPTTTGADTSDEELSAVGTGGTQSSGLGGALPLIGGSVLVFAVLGWFVFFRRPKDASGARRA